MLHILDYSWARPSPASIKAYPAIGVMRYIGPDTDGRDVDRAELESLWAEGLGVGFVYETSANRALAGKDAGLYDAGQAAYYLSLLGVPDGWPVCYACDCDVDYHETWGSVLDYYAGTMASPYTSRSYGEADVLDMVHETFGMINGWQPAATSWSGNRVSPYAAMHQQWPYVMNDQCDDNHVLVPNDQIDWLWGGDDMGLSTDDLHQIRNVVQDVVNETLTKMYANDRAVSVEGKPEVWEVVVENGRRARRYIPTPEEQQLLQWTDTLAGEKDAPPRIITEPALIEAFEALPVVGGAPAGGYGNVASSPRSTTTSSDSWA